MMSFFSGFFMKYFLHLHSVCDLCARDLKVEMIHDNLWISVTWTLVISLLKSKWKKAAQDTFSTSNQFNHICNKTYPSMPLSLQWKTQQSHFESLLMPHIFSAAVICRSVFLFLKCTSPHPKHIYLEVRSTDYNVTCFQVRNREVLWTFTQK